jgi:hypothetical protein
MENEKSESSAGECENEVGNFTSIYEWFEVEKI